MARKYLIETYGCQMNIHDSERMSGLLEQAGFESTTEEREADVIVINTCSVRERAEEKLFTRLGEIRMLSQETGVRPVVAGTGGGEPQEGWANLRSSKTADGIVGTQKLKTFTHLVCRALGPPPRP